jgi:hypothetical protein
MLEGLNIALRPQKLNDIIKDSWPHSFDTSEPVVG